MSLPISILPPLPYFIVLARTSHTMLNNKGDGEKSWFHPKYKKNNPVGLRLAVGFW